MLMAAQFKVKLNHLEQKLNCKKLWAPKLMELS